MLTQQLLSPYQLSDCNMHVGNFAHGSLGHAIEHEQVMGRHMTFNVQYKINKGGPCGISE